jgi:glycosyltransferase involved in cell wall biosynthesis
MINILFLIDHIWNSNGGTEGQLLMLLNNLDRNKYRVHLLCLKETPWSKTAKVDFPLKVLNIHKLLEPNIVFKIREFGKYCRANKIDIIQTYFNDSLIFGAIAGRISGVRKIIACRRNLGPGFWGRKTLLLAFRGLSRFVTMYMANSQATRESIGLFEGIDASRIDVIYNGLDLSRFAVINDSMRADMRRSLELDDSHVLIGMVAHLRKEKNISLFVEAAVMVGKKYPQARFIVLGEGGEREKIEKQVNMMGIKDIFRIGGNAMDIVPYLSAMDIACLTSDGESFSNSIIEYQAAGLPVVATRAGGNIEALTDGRCLFDPGDKEKFAQLLSSLIEDGSLRLQLGKAGRMEAEKRYSISNMVVGHEKMYAKCLNPR